MRGAQTPDGIGPLAYAILGGAMAGLVGAVPGSTVGAALGAGVRGDDFNE